MKLPAGLWLPTAARLFWFLAGLTKSRRVKLSNVVLLPMGVTRYSKHRGLVALEGAGLVSIERVNGRSPIVTLLDQPAEHSLELISD